jgi:nitrite reductase/ring-hydroxylating ferredoxin subunit
VTDPGTPRRRVLTAAALGGLTVPLLTACGGGGSSSAGADDPPSATSTGGNDGGTGQSPSALVATADVPVGSGVILASEDVVVTQPEKGTFEGFSATCTHAGCILASVSSGTINCGCHGSQFSIADGSNVAGPSGSPAGSVAPLPRVGIKVKGPNIIRG